MSYNQFNFLLKSLWIRFTRFSPFSSEKRLLVGSIFWACFVATFLFFLSWVAFFYCWWLWIICLLAGGILFNYTYTEVQVLDRKLRHRPICKTCLNHGIHLPKYDSYGCWKCVEWLEPDCGCKQDTCSFRGRKEKPFGE